MFSDNGSVALLRAGRVDRPAAVLGVLVHSIRVLSLAFVHACHSYVPVSDFTKKYQCAISSKRFQVYPLPRGSRHQNA